jgi:superfamily I DNA/RNA helicase
MVEKAMAQGVSPQRIGFFAFTRKAATEAKERAAKRFNLDPEVDLPHFRTLHSLAYRTLSVKEHQVMGKENFKELSEAIGFQLSAAAVTEESGSFKASDHPILQVINLARAKRVPLRWTSTTCSSCLSKSRIICCRSSTCAF